MGKRSATPVVQGVALIEQVIAVVQQDPQAIAGFCSDHPMESPTPLNAEALATLTFPSGKPLPPSLKRWLAYDTSWLAGFGWFDEAGHFAPRRLDEIVTAEFEDVWGDLYQPLSERLGECFLLPGGSDSRRIYAITQPDSQGEYPVLVIDTDDLPYIAVMYPGFDIFMGNEASIKGVAGEFYTYEALFDDPRYAERLNEHARHLFNGKSGIEMGIDDEEWHS